MLISDQCTEWRLSPKFPIAKSHLDWLWVYLPFEACRQQHLLLFETNLPKPFVLLTDALMFLLLLNKSLTKKQTSILPYSTKIFILPFSWWSFLNFFSHSSLKSKTIFWFFCLLFFPLCFVLLSFFSFLVLFLLLLFSFCTKLSQCISPWPISFFSFCTSAFLRIIHWFNWQSKKKASAKIHTTKPNKRKLCSKPCGGHEEERKSGWLLPWAHWKPKMEAKNESGEVWIGANSRFLFLGWLYTHL